MMPLPHLTPALIRSLDQVDALTSEDRLRGIQAQAGNPWGIEIKRFGRAVAFLAQGLPTLPLFNRVVGLGMEELPILDEVVAFYRDCPRVRIEILPGDLDQALSDRLASFGFRQTGFHAGFYGLPGTLRQPASSPVSVKRVRSAEEFDAFLETHYGGYGLPASVKTTALANMRHWRSLKDWYLYLAGIDGILAGAAILRIHETLGYLASAATIPRFRRRGCQFALLAQRLVDAAEMGCELVCSQAEFSSTSHHNLERAGLRLAYLKAIWTRS